ncbi:MgtE integral membrane region [Natrinema pellirubrum DSM 15624]|uniref:Cation transporter n=1 Tax=Natrinema pellirubrum (strain DSM 15624 / CIP 106293 / JCM 10476 / NCIMB 786 / 157) TaxID=797303 RepID=L0JPD2_NATP1|nr:magnesium transporter [Natrinema pellirubrum]AGB33375.1 cation transporter [Natrinema pellirubrum DSM 15624]ELY71203.1 MgtE integral membrane region [Natrinema pellirubrum DSM 15624]
MGATDPDESVNTWSIRSIVATMFPILIALSILEMGSGYVLEELEETYLANPTLLVLVPVMIGMGGNLGAILSSRLSTRLHLGLLEFDPRDEVLWTNVVAIFGLAATIFTALGIVAWLVGQFIAEPMALVDLMLISVVSGMVLAGLAIVLSVLATYVSYKQGLDPDDTTIPIVTNVCDILGVIVLSGVAIVVLN